MPEGDTILRTARTLTRAISGKAIARVLSPIVDVARAELAGHRIDAVEAHGKNLIVRFDDGRALHTHMRMNGAWHLYRAGERWRKPEHMARVAIEVEAAAGDPALVAVCFNAPVVRMIRDAASDPSLSRLGPDLLKDDFDARVACQRLQSLGAMPIGEAIVTQSAIAGIGNIYKSEALFARRIDPWAPVSSIADDALLALIDEARRMMRRNAGSPSAMRTTRARHHHGARFAVYDRSGARCLVCGEAIRMRHQGSPPRSTYYCARCQAHA
jgi:endonuclease-8